MKVILSRQTYTKLYTLFRIERSTTIPCPAAHPCIDHIRENPCVSLMSWVIFDPAYHYLCGYHTLKQH